MVVTFQTGLSLHCARQVDSSTVGSGYSIFLPNKDLEYGRFEIDDGFEGS